MQRQTHNVIQLFSEDQRRTERNQRCWAYLDSCTPIPQQIDLLKTRRSYRFGRAVDSDIFLPGERISNLHATISWDGKDREDSVVTIRDSSSNGTYVNGERIGRSHSHILRNGEEVVFGASSYKFKYCQTVGRSTDGLWAHYDLGGELGRGAFATVVKALHRRESKWYAVKIVHLDPARSSKRIRREVKIMQSLEHFNICQWRESFETENTLSIVLQWIRGGDLQSYVQKSKHGLSDAATKDIAYQICKALQHLHKKRIVHRDLKPANILLTTDVPPVVKVTDFGLAKMINEETRLETVCGTPSYLAPEVVEEGGARRGYTHAVDSWSLGVTIFFMLTCKLPFYKKGLGLKPVPARDINWDRLHQAEPASDCVRFVHGLLKHNPQYRLTMDDALQHLWLNGYTPSYIIREALASEYGDDSQSGTDHNSAAGDTELDTDVDQSTPRPVIQLLPLVPTEVMTVVETETEGTPPPVPLPLLDIPSVTPPLAGVHLAQISNNSPQLDNSGLTFDELFAIAQSVVTEEERQERKRKRRSEPGPEIMSSHPADAGSPSKRGRSTPELPPVPSLEDYDNASKSSSMATRISMSMLNQKKSSRRRSKIHLCRVRL